MGASEKKGENARREEVVEEYTKLEEKLLALFDSLKEKNAPHHNLISQADIQAGDHAQPSILGDFRILREIGSGGMATVYEAEQISLQRTVALKVLPPHLSVSDKAVQKFHREAAAGGRQKHPGIVAVYSIGEHKGIHYISQELIEGGATLADKLDELRREGLPEGYFREAAKCIAAVAEALEHAHASGVIHRDVKPSNILLTKEGIPKVGDFGLAKVESALALTRTGDFAGTPFYMSPEQAVSTPGGIDRRTDIFSLGVTLYEALTLVRPFNGETSQEVLKKILLQEPKEPRKINLRVPSDLSVICLKAIEKDPKQRYQTMKEFAEDLNRFLNSEPVHARPAGKFRKAAKWLQRHKLLSFAGAVTGLALLLAAILFFLISYQQQQKKEEARSRFKPIREALRWSEYFYYHRSIRRVYEEADPEDPCASLLHAVFLIGKSYPLSRIAEVLEECIKQCKHKNDPEVRNEALYLLGLTKLVLGENQEEGEEKSRLLKEGISALKEVDVFDLLSTKALVLKEEELNSSISKRARSLLSDVRINGEHFLIQKFLGKAILDDLYKGGERKDFEKAILHFKSALNGRPNDTETLHFLGRTLFFFARYYNYLEQAVEAEKLLKRALRITEERGGEQHYFTQITLGQICLLFGRDDLASARFHKALELTKDKKEREGKFHIHNAYGGLGRIFARRGNADEALKMYEKGLAWMTKDIQILVATAEIFQLLRNDSEKALQYATRATEFQSAGSHKPFSAEAYLAIARVLAKREQYAEAKETIGKMMNVTLCSPRSFSLAHLLQATLAGNDEDLQLGALTYYLQTQAPDSPLCLSAQGADCYCRGELQQASSYFERAMKNRERWPKDAREYHRLDDANDLYFLAMTHCKLGEKKPEEGEHRVKATRCFNEAEKIFQKKKEVPFIRFRDIAERIRNKARDVLGEAPEADGK